MSEFVAGAFVEVKPLTKGFRSDLRKQTNDAIKDVTIKVPVELDPKRFKSTVAAAARQTQAKVPIVTSTSVTALRKEIQDKITRATTGLKVKVPIEIVQTGPGSRGGAPRAATTGAGGAAQAAGAAAAAAAASSSTATTSAKKQTAAQKQQEQVTRALAKADNELAIAQRLLAQAQSGGITAEERATRLREARQASSRSLKAANDLLATSEAKLTAAQKRALEARVTSATTERTSITTKQAELKLQTTQTTILDKSTKTRKEATAVMGVEIKQITSLNRLHIVENELLAIEARLKSQTNRARDAGVASTVRANEALLTEIKGRKDLIIAQRDALKGESARERQQRTATRGAFSSALSLLGVRGATLAANNAFLIGAAGATLFAKAVASFAGLETQLNVFAATTGATAEQMRQVSEAAIALGADITLPGVSASNAAEAMVELSRAGLNVRDSIAGARGVLELASAAQISFGEAASFTASALNAFALSGDDAVRVADLLANAANFAQGSISEMGAAMQQALTIANLVGFSLTDTIATLGLFARNGLRGSDAGTSLRTALSRLIAPTKVASELINELNINLRDARGNLRPDVFVQFGEATKDISPALRDMIAQTIAGQDAIRAFAIGADEGRRGLQLARLQMQATGSAAALAGARAKGLGGSFRALGSNVQTLGTQMGKFAAGPVSAVVQQLNGVATVLNQLATGDFSGIFEGLSNDFEQLVRNLQRHGEGFSKVFDPTSSFKEFRAGLREIFTPAPKEDRIAQLQEALARLNNLRVQSFEIGANIEPLTKQIQRIRKELRDAKVDAGLIIPVTDLEKQLAPLREAVRNAENLRKEIIDAGGSSADTKFLDDLIRNFNVRIKITESAAKNSAKAIKDGIKEELTGSDIANSFKRQFDLITANVNLATPEVLSALNDMIGKIKQTAPLTGQAGRQVGETLMQSITAAIQAATEEDNPEVAEALTQLANKIAALFTGSVRNAFKGIKVPETEESIMEALLPERIASARAEAFGSVDTQIATKEAELEKLRKGLGKVIKGSEDEEKLLNAVSAKRSEINSLRERQATDQKEADEKADQKIIDSLSSREQSLLNDLQRAQTTEGLKNDIRAQLALRDFYTQQEAVIRRSVRDAEKRNDALDENAQKLFEVEQDLAKSRAGRREQIRNAAVKKIDEAAERAAESESLADDLRQADRRVRFWRNEVKIVKKLLADRKATGDELQAALDALDEAEDEARNTRRERRDQRREQRAESLELDIQFAELTENRNAELRARQAFIKFLEEQKRAAKGNILKIKELRNQIAEQKQAIKELNEEAKDDKGTTAFELLADAASIFKETGGNLITGSQPFAGPTGFTADMAQFLFRQQRANAAQPLPTTRPTTSDALSRNDAAHFGRLTDALDRLTNTINRTPGTGRPSTQSARSIERNDRRHFDVATASRQVIERRSGI